jgi:hypothetical protein
MMSEKDVMIESRKEASEKTMKSQASLFSLSALQCLQQLSRNDGICIPYTPREGNTGESYFIQNSSKIKNPYPLDVPLQPYSKMHNCSNLSYQKFQSNPSIGTYSCREKNLEHLTLPKSLSPNLSSGSCNYSEYSTVSLSLNDRVQSDDSLSKELVAREKTSEIEPKNLNPIHNSSLVAISESINVTRIISIQELYGRNSSQKNDLNNSKNLLYLEGNDEKSLSAYQCLIRKLIQYFEATKEDIKSTMQGRNKPIMLKQVRIRCCFCAKRAPQHRTRGSTYYPSTLQGLYQASQNLASVHLSQNCPLIPENLMVKLLKLRAIRSSVGGGKRYWADSASLKGIFESNSILLISREHSQI